ncbi:hypothetical protein LINPERHAP1_LOCUS14748 [Linum perenne]
MAIDCCIPSSAKIPHCPSPVRLPPLPRPRDRRWFHSHLFTALLLAAALLLATSAWLSLVFSGTAAPCFHRRSFPDGLPTTAIRKPPPQLAGFPLLGSLNGSRGGEDRLSLEHLVFGIAGSSQLWERRKEFLRLWWRPNEMRGHVWLDKYDSSEMVYIGSPSESHSANSYFSHSMAFGGGGIAISRPLAEALSNILDECIDRYHESYGSDDRLHACISELGIPLSREHGFHQFDIRGNAHGLLSTHPIAPFVSIHHVEAVDPFYPGLTTLDSLRLFTKAMSLDPASFLQRSICYDHVHRLSFVVSLGYVVQVYPGIVLPRVLERSEKTYAAWNGVSKRDEFDVDTRDTFKSSCKRPVFFFLKDAVKQNNDTLGTYQRAKINDDLKRRVFCFPQSPPIPHVASIRVLARPLRKNWHLVPRRLCCRLNHTSNELLTIVVAECGKGSRGSVTDST